MVLGIRSSDPVAAILSGPVASIHPTATLREAAGVLTASSVGLLIVLHTGKVRGVISERDIVAALAEELDVDLERVRDHASHDLVAVAAGTSVEEAARTMATAEVRHLVVRDGDQLLGVLSLRDLTAALLDELAGG